MMQSIAALSALCLFFMASSYALAQQCEDVVCAAVVPCDKDGKVFAAFDSGACAPYYRALCLQVQANDLSRQLDICEAGKEDLQAQLKSMKNRILQLRKKVLKSSRHSSR